MLNYSTDCVLVVDADFEVVQVNENFLDFLGVRRGEIIEKSLEESSYFQDIESELISHVRAAMDGKEYSGEISFSSQERDKFFEVRVLPTTFVDGRIGATIVMQNITERKETEMELKRSEEKFRSSFEASPDPTFLLDKEGVCRDINEVAVRMLGYEKEEIIGKPIPQLPFVSDEVIQETMDKFRRRQQGEEIPPYEVELTTKSGDTKYVELNVGTFEVAEFEGEIVIARDVTERKKAEEELRRSREEYMDLINSMDDVFVVHDLEGNFIEGNDFLFEILGYSEEELKSMDVGEITCSEEEEIERKLKRVKDEGSLKFEVEVKTKEGKKIPVEINANLAEYGDKPAILSIARDITERKKMEQKLRKSEERYREIFTNSRDALWVVRVMGEDEFLYEDVNREFFQNFTGMDKDEMVGKRLMELHSQGFYKKETGQLPPPKSEI